MPGAGARWGADHLAGAIGRLVAGPWAEQERGNESTVGHERGRGERALAGGRRSRSIVRRRLSPWVCFGTIAGLFLRPGLCATLLSRLGAAGAQAKPGHAVLPTGNSRAELYWAMLVTRGQQPAKWR